MVMQPRLARHIKLSARGGDEAYAVSELLIYGSKTRPGRAGRLQ